MMEPSVENQEDQRSTTSTFGMGLKPSLSYVGWGAPSILPSQTRLAPKLLPAAAGSYQGVPERVISPVGNSMSPEGYATRPIDPFTSTSGGLHRFQSANAYSTVPFAHALHSADTGAPLMNHPTSFPSFLPSTSPSTDFTPSYPDFSTPFYSTTGPNRLGSQPISQSQDYSHENGGMNAPMMSVPSVDLAGGGLYGGPPLLLPTAGYSYNGATISSLTPSLFPPAGPSFDGGWGGDLGRRGSMESSAESRDSKGIDGDNVFQPSGNSYLGPLGIPSMSPSANTTTTAGKLERSVPTVGQWGRVGQWSPFEGSNMTAAPWRVGPVEGPTSTGNLTRSTPSVLLPSLHTITPTDNHTARANGTTMSDILAKAFHSSIEGFVNAKPSVDGNLPILPNHLDAPLPVPSLRSPISTSPDEEAIELPDFTTFNTIVTPPPPGVAIETVDERKGLGLVATKIFTPGELIFSEAALMVMPVRVREKNLVRKFVTFPRQQQELIMSLSDPQRLENTGEPGSITLQRVAKINRVDLFNAKMDSPNSVPKLTRSGRGLYSWLSRINHSCSPNAFVKVTAEMVVRDAWTTELYALREIKQGEEIVISYVWPSASAGVMLSEERLKFLAEQFQFDCCCSICDKTSPDYGSAEALKLEMQTIATTLQQATVQGNLVEAATASVLLLDKMQERRNDNLSLLMETYLKAYQLVSCARQQCPNDGTLPNEDTCNRYLEEARAISHTYQGHWLPTFNAIVSAPPNEIIELYKSNKDIFSRAPISRGKDEGKANTKKLAKGQGHSGKSTFNKQSRKQHTTLGVKNTSC